MHPTNPTGWLESLRGRVFNGAYRVDELIGLGGVGAVFRGQHVVAGHTVAIKILRRELVDSAEFRERFRREAEALANLKHPGVVDILAFGVDPDCGAYLVMEDLQGESLRNRIATLRRPLSPNEIIPLVIDVLDTLDVIHSAGYIHRDITPGNIFIVEGSDGTERTKILDFGIARIVGAPGAQVTQVGISIGTAPFLSSEQAQGRRDIDHRLDICTLGLVLYTCLTGHPPYGGTQGVDLIDAAASRSPIPLHVVCPGTSPAISAVIAQAVHVDREFRFQSAAAFRRALLHAVERARHDGYDLDHTDHSIRLRETLPSS